MQSASCGQITMQMTCYHCQDGRIADPPCCFLCRRLVGSLGLMPLTFILPPALWIKVRPLLP